MPEMIAGRLEPPAGEAGQDDVPLGLDVGQDADDGDVELFDPGAGEDRPALARHARLDLGQGQDGRGRAEDAAEEGRAGEEGQGAPRRAARQMMPSILPHFSKAARIASSSWSVWLAP